MVISFGVIPDSAMIDKSFRPSVVIAGSTRGPLPASKPWLNPSDVPASAGARTRTPSVSDSGMNLAYSPTTCDLVSGTCLLG